MKVIIRVRFTNSVALDAALSDLDLPFLYNPSQDDINRLVSTSWIKAQIRLKVPQTNDRRLRLIYNGRVLNVETNYKRDVFNQLSPQSGEDLVVFIHCVVGEHLTRQQLEEESLLDNATPVTSTTPQQIGFDRLLNQGFLEEDVRDLRRQFLAIHAQDQPLSGQGQIADVEDEEQRQRRLREMEEQWIEQTMMYPSADGTSLARPAGPGAAADGANARPAADLEDYEEWDLVFGMLLGLFLGAVAVVWLLSDLTVFSKRQQWSIVAGILANTMIALTHIMFRA